MKAGKKRVLAAVVLAAAAACLMAGGLLLGRKSKMEKPVQPGKEQLVVYCPHPLEFINSIVSEFEYQTGIPVYVQRGGTGQLLSKMEKGEEPGCDIFWGGSLPTALSKEELFEPYISKNEPMFREEFKNVQGNMTRFTDMPSVIMVNTNLIGDIEIRGYEDLLQPELKGRIAMCDPAASSSAYEHLANMLCAMGKDDGSQGWDYVRSFCENLDGVLLKSSAQVYEGVAKGNFAVGLTFEEVGARCVSEGAPVELIYMEEGVISRPDVVCIAKGTDKLKEAREFVDFVTGRDAQLIIANKLGRRSVRRDVEGPDHLPPKSSLTMLQDDDEASGRSRSKRIQEFRRIAGEVALK